KQPARAITPTEPTDVQRTEAEQLKIALTRSRQETHISQQRGSGTDEGTEDTQTGKGGDEVRESEGESNEEETRQEEEESIDPIPRTPEEKMELKKILIEKMEGNKYIQRSDEQQNLYKALVEAYDADKAILDTYGDSTILKRRREDDDQE
nr:hypothetical protein [Tanacetum cinerariifolium]